MLLVADTFDKIDIDKLMSVYKEASAENANYLYPEILNREEGDEYKSALRISEIEKRLFYLEALETSPNYRKKGYAVKLLNLTKEYLKREGSFTVKDSVKKTNEASIKAHQKAGFVIESQKAVNYLKKNYDNDNYGMSYNYTED